MVVYCELSPHPSRLNDESLNPVYDGTYVWFKLPGSSNLNKAKLKLPPDIGYTNVNATDFHLKVTYQSDITVRDLGADIINPDYEVELQKKDVPKTDLDVPKYGILTKASPTTIIIGGVGVGEKTLLGEGFAFGEGGFVATSKNPSTDRDYGGVFKKNPLSFLPSFAFLPLPNYLPSMTIFSQVAGLTAMTTEIIKSIKDLKNTKS